ncbi:DUF2061 domain-containing protein [Flammeovirga yaeyamensis]|uniref:DUF2061 domain-containing protein n=1 Tax=Flammeovirga yaeyamensis TaxID=367791 RepID=A0AAX1N3V8_9BACT|nr:DUF2061 domain-containing protein [Flammeovirga yaeyamensis]MBB3700971.1 putative membrane protein [Flammeovirga yaeyamensis]NMF38078.1 DUF2061 domain-containing protein [Flammeovirga yaeyamensis]QWG00727.1 DUF2061 domain-containing protein [Flammeovirga yaeyamensis]
MFRFIDRKLAKAISWRFWGTLDTILWGSLISGSSNIGFSIGAFELITKISLYYLHEWIWEKWRTKPFWKKRKNSFRHLVKAISWRLIGTIDTIILAWVISGQPLVGVKVGIAEVVTKIFLYYLHERLWHLFRNNKDEQEKVV